MAASKRSKMIKTPEDIVILREGGAMLARVLNNVAHAVVPGITTEALDAQAAKEIRAARGEPSFFGYQPPGAKTPFPSTLCISINSEVVHAPATPAREIKQGDIVKLDIGMRYPAQDGLYTDMAMTIPVGSVKTQELQLVTATRDALDVAITQVKPGNHISDIAAAIEQHVQQFGFSPVRDLVGHGVGYAVHEAPEVPNYWMGGMADYELVPGMVIAIEPIINMGGWRVRVAPDGWTILSADGKPSAHFEHTVAVTESGCEVLTALPKNLGGI